MYHYQFLLMLKKTLPCQTLSTILDIKYEMETLQWEDLINSAKFGTRKLMTPRMTSVI